MRLISIVLSLFLFFPLFSQDNFRPVYQKLLDKQETENVVKYDLFEKDFNRGYEISNDLDYNQIFYSINASILANIIDRRSELIEIDIPYNGSVYSLEMYEVNLFSEFYHLETSDGRSISNIYDKVFYRGALKNNPNSIVVASFYSDDIRIVINDHGNTLRLKKTNEGNFVMYNETMIDAINPMNCSSDLLKQRPGTQTLESDRSVNSGNCIEMYYEADYATYQDNGSSVSNTENYVTSLFNEVQTIYDNEDIPFSIAEIFVWTSSDPYSGYSSTQNMLYAFGDQIQDSYDGRLAQLLSVRNVGGGIAWIDVLCETYDSWNSSGPYSVIGNLASNIQAYPTYSFSVNGASHEIGHNIGSPHTHACAWNGNNTQIDDCGNEYYYNNGWTPEGDACYDPNNPILPSSGTIMSYCHLLSSVGIDLTNGFGPQPGDLVRSKYNNASCVTGCDGPPSCTSLTFPLNASVDIELNITLQWSPVADATGYLLKVGTSSGSGDIVNNVNVGSATSYNLTNLPTNTQIYVKITPYNGFGNAIGCSEQYFTTIIAPPDCTSLLVPDAEDTSVDVGTDISWFSAATAEGYIVYIGTSSGVYDILDNEDVGNTTTISLDSPLPYNSAIFVTIIPYNNSGNATGCDEQVFYTELPPPDCPIMFYPEDGAINVSISTSITWTTTDDTYGYTLKIGTTEGGDDVFPLTEFIGTTSYTPDEDFDYSTTYYVTINAFNIDNESTGCSSYTFTTIGLPPPDCPVMISPENGSTGIDINSDISWNPVDGAIGYLIAVGTTSGGIEIMTLTDVGNVTSYDIGELPYNTTIYLTLLAYNQDGNSVNCDEFSFTTSLPQPPECAIFTNPQDGAVGVSLDIDITWDEVTGATSYSIMVGTTPDGDDILSNTNIGTNNYYYLEGLEYSTTYYITVIPENEGGSIDCDPVSFTTMDIPIPDCVVIISPENGELDVSIGSTITWQSSDNAEGYYINIGTTPGGVDLVDNEDVGNSLEYVYGDYPYGTIIYVTVIPYNSSGSSTGCTEFSFTTEPVPVPICPTILSPENGATNVNIDTEISWSDVDFAEGYLLTVGTTPGGNDILDNESLTGTSYQLSALSYETTIYISVIAFNSSGQSVDCEESVFTTASDDAPTCPIIISPENGAVNISTDIEISWEASTGTVSGYKLTLATTEGGNDILDHYDVGNSTTFMATDLPNLTTIFINIIPYNDNGDYSGCSSSEFTTIIAAPGCSTMIAPENGAMQIDIATSIEWEAVDEAEGYILSLSTSPGLGDIIDNLDIGNITEYSPENDLPYNQTIYVLVIPYNIGGQAIDCIEGSFETGTTDIVKIIENDYLYLFPNPAKSIVNIKHSSDVIRLMAFNAIGQKVMDINQPTDNLDVSNLVEGVYLFNILTQNKVYTIKVIIEK